MRSGKAFFLLGLGLAAALALSACQVFGGAPAGSIIGDFVWVDDGDGIYEEGELPLPEVTVRLHSADKGEVAGETVTDADGEYFFDGLEPGEYFLEFVPPEGYSLTLKDQGDDDTLDSDPDPDTHETDVFKIGDKEAALDWDAGMIPAEAEPTSTPTPAATPTKTPTPTPVPPPSFDDPEEDTLDCAAGTVDLDPASDIVHVTWEPQPDGSVVIRVYIVAAPEDPTQSEYSYAVVVTFNPNAGDEPTLIWEWHDGGAFIQGDVTWGMLPGLFGPQVPGPTFRVPAEELPDEIQSIMVTVYHMAESTGTWWCDDLTFEPPAGP